MVLLLKRVEIKMSRSDRVIKTTIIYFIGNFASKLLSFFLLPLYTAYLTSVDYGTVDILMSTLPLIEPIFTMQVTESVFRFLMTDNTDEDRKKTITSSLGIFVAGVLIFIILYTPFLYKLNFKYGGLFLVYFVVTYVGIFLQQVLRGLQRTIEYAVTGVISTVVHATLNIFLIVKIGLGGEALLISSIAGSFVITVFMVLRTKIWNYIDVKRLSGLEISRQLKFGIPLIPNQIAWWVIGLLGKYILLYYHGVADNGVLAVANKFPNIIAIINAIFLKAWTENVIKEYNSEDRDEYFSSGLTRFTVFTISISACLLPVIKIYNILTIKGDFTSAWKFVPLLLLGSSFNSLAAFLGTIYTASMKTKQAFTTTIIAATSNFIFSLILIPTLSIWGVVISNMISFMILYQVRIKSVNNIINLQVNFTRIIPSLILLVASVYFYYTMSIYVQIFSIIIIGLATLYLNRSILFNLFSFVTRIKKG